MHERVERVFLNLAVKAPHRFNQRAPRNHLPGAVHQAFQQVVFGPCKRNVHVSAGNFAAGGIEGQIAHRQVGFLHRQRAALHGPQAGHEFVEGEGLGHVIVRAQVEAANDIRHRVLGREHQDRGADFLCPQALGQFISAELRHHHVQNNDVELVGLGHSQAFGPVEGAHGIVAFLGEPFAQQVGHARLVFNDQQLHCNVAGSASTLSPQIRSLKRKPSFCLE